MNEKQLKMSQAAAANDFAHEAGLPKEETTRRYRVGERRTVRAGNGRLSLLVSSCVLWLVIYSSFIFLFPCKKSFDLKVIDTV